MRVLGYPLGLCVLFWPWCSLPRTYLQSFLVSGYSPPCILWSTSTSSISVYLHSSATIAMDALSFAPPAICQCPCGLTSSCLDSCSSHPYGLPKFQLSVSMHRLLLHAFIHLLRSGIISPLFSKTISCLPIYFRTHSVFKILNRQV